MAKKELVENIVNLYSKLGGNIGDVLGSRSNITFLGTGKNPEPFIDMNINMEAVGVLGKSKILEELKSPMGYLAANKLNDIQATKLYNNMLKLEEFYYPKQVANITDMATGTRDLTQEGIMTLRRGGDPTKYKPGDPITSENFGATGFAPTKRAKGDYMTDEGVMASETILPMRRGTQLADDLPPPGSRGGPDDIAAPIQSAEETIKQLRIQDPDLADQVRRMVDKGIISTVGNKGNVPAKRSSAREFLVEALKKDEYDVGTAAFGKVNLNNVISAQDVKFITEGGGGVAGDPLVLVEKYFGPKIAELLPAGATGDEIVRFTNRVLTSVEDAAGLRPDNPRFDRTTARFVDEMAQGGRVGLLNGGKAKRQRFFEGALADTKEGKAMSPGTTASGGFRGDAGQGDSGNIIVPPPNNPVSDNYPNVGPRFNTELVNRKIALDRALANYDLNNVVEDEDDQNINTTGVTQNTIDTIFNPDVASNIDQIKTTTTNLLNADPDLKASLEMAQGGRAGFKLGKSVFQGIANIFKKGADDVDLVKQEETFRTGPITMDFLEKVNPKVTDKFIRTRDMRGSGGYGLYNSMVDMPPGLQAAEFIKNIRGPRGNVDYEKAEMYIGGGVKLTGKETVDELIEMFLNAVKQPLAKGGLAKILEV